MKTYQNNGEYWYENNRSAMRRALRWLCWIGGVGGHRTPIAILGHRVVFFDWGANVRLSGGDLLVVSWCGVDPSLWWRTKPVRVYVSHDGTPGCAHTWIVGAPRDVMRSVRQVGPREEYVS